MWGVFEQYNGDSLYLLAFAASFLLTMWQCRKKGLGIWKELALAMLLAFLFVFNGLSYRIAGKLTKNIKTYYRFFWMLPVLFLTAYQLTLAFTSGQKKKALLGGVALILCLGVGANCFVSRATIMIPDNIYGIAQDAIDVSDAIVKDWGGQKGQPVAAFDSYLQYQIRTYEPRICWGISRKAYLYQQTNGYDGKKYRKQQLVIAAVSEGAKGDSRTLAHCMKKLGIDYLAIQTVFDMDDYLAAVSVYPVAYSRSYTIYKVE